MKLILGYHARDPERLKEKQELYRKGLLDNYQCFICVPGDKHHEQQYTFVKVKDVRKYMYEVYTDELFALVDLELFIKNEIESKAIVVIDEIDKLVRSPDSASSTKASDEGVQYDLLPILDGTTVSVNQSKVGLKH